MAITFPLVFGWIHFGSAPDDQMTYVTYLFGFPDGLLPHPHGRSPGCCFTGWTFPPCWCWPESHSSLWRRMRDRGALTLQDFGTDFLPLFMLFAISVTGLALTASTLWLRGAFYGFLAILHAITVIGALLYLPFGKFFHIFQRPAQLGVKLYQAGGSRGRRDALRPLRRAFRLQDADRRSCEAVLPQLGFDYRMHGSGGSLAGLCARRASAQRIATAQLGSRSKLVAKPPAQPDELVDITGRTSITRHPAGGARPGSDTPDKLVKTHCSLLRNAVRHSAEGSR